MQRRDTIDETHGSTSEASRRSRQIQNTMLSDLKHHTQHYGTAWHFALSGILVIFI